MNKYHKNRITNQPKQSIDFLHHKLFGKLDDTQHRKQDRNQINDPFFYQFQQESNPYSHQLLQKAKKVTYSNKGKIEKMRSEIKKMQQVESADFITEVGLYNQQQQPQQLYADFDQDSLMQNLRETKFDDLAELRRMIKKTESNLKQYSQSVYDTQTHIVNAADKCGKEIDVGLSMKINRCGLQRTFYKQNKLKDSALLDNASPLLDNVKKRTMSSHNARRNKL